MENNLNGMGPADNSQNPNPQPQPEPKPESMPVDPMSSIESTRNPTPVPVEETPMPEPSPMPASGVMGGASMPPTNNPPYFESQPPMAPRKSKGLMFALIGLAVFFLLLLLTATAVVMAAYGKFDLPDKKMQEKLSYFVQNIPFMPKTPKYVLLKSAQVHQSIGSAYTKISFSAKSPTFTEIPGIGDTLDFLIEGPIDASDPKNPKLSWNMKLTKELDMDLKVMNENLYFRVNKLPTLVYPFIGLTASNFASNPITNRWVYYDLSTLDTEASSMLDERGDDVTVDEMTEEKLLLIGEKLADKMTMSSDEIDGVAVNKITLKLTNNELSELEPEIMEILEIDQKLDTTYTSGNSPIAMIDNVEINVYIEKATYYMRRFDAAVDVIDTAANEYSQVLGVSTIATEGNSSDKISLAMSASLSQLGETFDSVFVAPAGAISLEQFILEISDFFTNQQMASQQPPAEGFSSGDDLSGFDDAQIYAPPSVQSDPSLDGFGAY